MPPSRGDDPVALRSDRLFGLFTAYLAFRMSRDFAALRRSGPVPDGPGGLIVYSNHPGWWDPATFLVLSARLFAGRPGFGPMEARAFERYGIFRRMGVFGIETDSARGARRFLEVSRRVLSEPRHMIWITAEGEFADPRRRPVVLRPGIAHLARQVGPARLVPLAISYEFWNESRPEALVRFGAPVGTDEIAAAARDGGTGAVASMLARRLEATMDALAADAGARDPSRFTTVVAGRTGADAIYDTWRRARAALAGRRFRAAHGDDH